MPVNQLNAGNDATVAITALTNAATGAALNAATVTAQLYARTATGAEEAVGSPVSLSYVAASSGNYTGVIESSVIDAHFEVGDYYRIGVVASQGGVNAEFNLEDSLGRRRRT